MQISTSRIELNLADEMLVCGNCSYFTERFGKIKNNHFIIHLFYNIINLVPSL